MAPLIAITGATGRVGAIVARQLAAQSIEQRLVVRSPDRAPQLPGAEVVQASYGDEATVAALAGIDTVLMVSAAEDQERVDQHLAFVDNAARAGVRRIVYLSFFGASPTAAFLLAREHWMTEEAIRRSGLRFTLLRDNFYMEEVLNMVGDDGAIRGPAADGRLAAVSLVDVADAAAAVLRAAHRAITVQGRGAASEHDGEAYELTGPQSLTLHEVAEVITRATGRPTRYEPETVPQAYATRAVYDAPGWQVDAWVSTYTAIASGELARVTADVEKITGRPPRTLRQVCAG